MNAHHAADELVFLALGGAGEIGMNLNLYGYGPAAKRKWLMIDLGITFSDDSTPGVDIIMPDPAFIEEHRKDLLALVVTHGHEDHIGAVPHLWRRLRCPVYATPFTAVLLRHKLEEAGLGDQVKIKILPMSGKVTIGPFDLELVTLTHSIPEPNGVIIRTALGTVMHTGDWKIDPDPLLGDVTDDAALTRLGEEGVLAMVCDSTNVFQSGTAGSEATVRDSLIELIREQTGAVAVTAFASNVARLDSVVKAAHACGRKCVLVGRSMHKMVAAARETGYLTDLPALLDEDRANDLPRNKVLYLCTGSQGEERAALMRIATGSHNYVSLTKGDSVIFSSRIIPGNERRIFEVQNLLSASGVKIITERDHFVHVSGHPCRDELTQMYQWVRPQIAVPVHGETRHMIEHAALARSLQIPQTPVIRNGDMLRLAPGPAVIIDEVPSGRLLLDGDILSPSEGGAIGDRRKLAANGLVGVTLVMDDRGELLADAQVIMRGVPLPAGKDADGFIDALAEAVEEAVEKLGKRDLKDDGAVEEATRKALRRVLRADTGKRPMIEVRIVRLD
jgi:ribonuclease J